MRTFAALLLVVLLVAGCVEPQEEPPAVFQVFLPLIHHDCSWIVREQEYRNAVAVCETRMQELRATEGRTRLVEDCATPEAQDYCR